MSLGFDQHGRLHIVHEDPVENTQSLRILAENPKIVAEQQVLDLRWVPLDSLPIEPFCQLKALYLHKNQLSQLPDLNGCSSLQILSLGKNYFTALPSSIKDLWMSLQYLYLGDNQIQTLPFQEEEMMIAHGSIGSNPLPEPVGDRWMLRADAVSCIAALHMLSRAPKGIPHALVQELRALFIHNCIQIDDPMVFSLLLEGYRWKDGEGLYHEEHNYRSERLALTELLETMGPEVNTHPSIGKKLVHRPRAYWFSS